MEKKALLESRSTLFLIGIVFVLGFLIYFQIGSKSLEDKVLDSLEKDFEFCKVIRANDEKFWLMCNNRPFYAEYQKGKVTYELNGWGFLKEQPEILNEITEEKCRFYDSKDNNLTFICESKVVKIYELRPLDFKIKKIDEVSSLDYFSKLLSRYDCTLSDEKMLKMDGETFFKLAGYCQDKPVIMFFNLDKRYSTLPIIIKDGISDTENADVSFEMLSVCKKNYIQDIGKDVLLGMDCKLAKPDIVYDFELDFAYFLIRESDFTTLFPYLGKYNLQDMAGKKLTYLESQKGDHNTLHYYLTGNKVIVAKSINGSGLISEIYFKEEKIE